MFYYTSQSSSSATNVRIQPHHHGNTPLSANTQTSQHGQTTDEPEHIDTHESIELANNPTAYNTPSKAINTPKSYTSDDSLWLAMENDGVDIHNISIDNHSDHHHHHLEYLREVFPENHNDVEREAQEGLLKNYFNDHHQNSFLRYNDGESGILTDRTKDLQMDRPTERVNSNASTTEYYGQQRDTINHSNYIEIQDDRVLNKQRTTCSSVPMFNTRRTTDTPLQQGVPKKRMYHEHHQQHSEVSNEHVS